MTRSTTFTLAKRPICWNASLPRYAASRRSLLYGALLVIVTGVSGNTAWQLTHQRQRRRPCRPGMAWSCRSRPRRVTLAWPFFAAAATQSTRRSPPRWPWRSLIPGRAASAAVASCLSLGQPPVCIDYREIAGRRDGGHVRQGARSVFASGCGVPDTAYLAVAHHAGETAVVRVAAPAVALAEDGFAVDAALAEELTDTANGRQPAPSSAAFCAAEG